MLTFKEGSGAAAGGGGGGLLNTLINKLPFEAHIPGYRYCGPGTKLEQRLQRGDAGINLLDQACKDHDIAYSQSTDLNHRHQADQILQERAWSRAKSKDASFGEKSAAWIVTNAMKVKRKFGMGVDRRKRLRRRQLLPFNKVVLAKIKDTLKKTKPENLKIGARVSLSAAKLAIRRAGGKRNIKTPRIIPLPRTQSGGFLPLIPLFAGLSALGALAGGASGIAKAVNTSKAAQRQLDEAQRHNKTMEAIALGGKTTSGSGLYLRPYRRGLGLFLKPYSKNF